VEESSSNGEEQRGARGCRSETPRFGLAREDKVLTSSDYTRINREGSRFRTPHFLIRTTGSPAGRLRLGIVAGRKVGKACVRNRIKRKLREYFRLNRERLPPFADVVFIPLAGAVSLSLRQLSDELDRFFKKASSKARNTRS
jgi:ribonuclease P protein component